MLDVRISLPAYCYTKKKQANKATTNDYFTILIDQFIDKINQTPKFQEKGLTHKD